MTPEQSEELNMLAERQAELDSLAPITFPELETAIKKWLLIADDGVIKLLCAAYLANKLPAKAVWVFFVGPSGAGKTELLNCLLDLPDIFSISSITANTFISGANSNASLLPKLGGKTMIFKDWTTMLSLDRDTQTAIMAQLREIWDGEVSKSFGTGKSITWKGKVGLIAGSTQVIDLAQQQNAKLGERFIFYRILMPDRKEVARRTIFNDGKNAEMSKELRNAFYAFLKGVDVNAPIPSDDPVYIEELIRLTDFITQARSSVIRDFGFKKEVLFVPHAEMPTRVTQQLNCLAKSLMIINKGPLTDHDRKIIYKAALDSVPSTNKMVLMQVAKRQNQTTAEIATALGYPTSTIHIYLENMAMLKVLKRYKGSDTEEGGNADRWAMSDDYVSILRTYEMIPDENFTPVVSEPIGETTQALLDGFGGEVI